MASTEPEEEAPSPLERVRLLADVGRRAVRRTILDDPALRDQLDRLGVLNPAIADDPDAQPIRSVGPRKILARALMAMAQSRQSVLGSAGVSSIEVLASALGSEDQSGEPVPDTICIAFTDIMGFTAYTVANGDEAALAMLERQAAVAEPAIKEFGGTIVKRIGDGLMLRFPDAESGVAAVLEMIDRLTADNADHPDAPIELRAGVTIGRPIVVGTDLVGGDVNLAARLTEAAGGSQILVTETLRAAVTANLDSVRFVDRGYKQLKGFDALVEAAEAQRVPQRGVRGR